MATNAKTYRPEEIAATLGISGKVVRAYLRQTFTRPIEAKGTTWVLSADMAKQTLAHFRARNPKANA
jgi:predicted site-specific integrase-resolvase